jgi:nitrate reductase beta subunit
MEKAVRYNFIVVAIVGLLLLQSSCSTNSVVRFSTRGISVISSEVGIVLINRKSDKGIRPKLIIKHIVDLYYKWRKGTSSSCTNKYRSVNIPIKTNINGINNFNGGSQKSLPDRGVSVTGESVIHKNTDNRIQI